MGLDLANYEGLTRKASVHFWLSGERINGPSWDRTSDQGVMSSLL
jgi:hypothetical protein